MRHSRRPAFSDQQLEKPTHSESVYMQENTNLVFPLWHIVVSKSEEKMTRSIEHSFEGQDAPAASSLTPPPPPDTIITVIIIIIFYNNKTMNYILNEIFGHATKVPHLFY